MAAAVGCRTAIVDLFVLPEVLASVDRLVVLPADAVVLGDVAELAGLDLHGNLLAAPTVVGDRASSGFVLIHAASGRLKAKTHASAELRRRAYARHAFDFDAFDADVLVIDAAEYRRREMVSTYVPLIEEFGLTYRELLHFEVGPHRAVDRRGVARGPVAQSAGAGLAAALGRQGKAVDR